MPRGQRTLALFRDRWSAAPGKPISFAYFDSGYGDNKPFDVMVRVFPMP
jgi:hypothetical protein